MSPLARASSQRHGKRMRQSGIVITNAESVVFEWLTDARHEQFKAVSALLK